MCARQGKEYVVDGKLTGKDASAGCPQAYGLTTRDEFLDELRHQLESAGEVGVGLAQLHKDKDKAGGVLV